MDTNHVSLEKQFAEQVLAKIRERVADHTEHMTSGMYDSFSQYNRSQGVIHEMKSLEDEIKTTYKAFFGHSPENRTKKY